MSSSTLLRQSDGAAAAADAPSGALLKHVTSALKDSNAEVRQAAALAVKRAAKRNSSLAEERPQFVQEAVPALLALQRGMNLSLKQSGERALLYLARPFEAEAGATKHISNALADNKAFNDYNKRVLAKLQPDTDDEAEG